MQNPGGTPLSTATVPLSQAWLRLALFGLAFASAYTLCNHLTHGRSDVGAAVFEWERTIPFVPWTIVPYLSLPGFVVASLVVRRQRDALNRHCAALCVNLLLSLLCYAWMPLRFQFDRPVPQDIFGPLFVLLSTVDLPYNRAPSLHISVLLIVWLRLVPLCVGWRRRLLTAWFVLIGLSVLTTWQHHVVDVFAGLAVGGLSLALVFSGATSRRRQTLVLRPRDFET
jgi:membrane-associated phospholipid phosphatase